MNLLRQLQDIFREVFDDPDLQINAAMSQKEFPEWDSFAHVRLIMMAEAEFKVRFNFDEVSTIKDVGAFVEALSRRVGPQ